MLRAIADLEALLGTRGTRLPDSDQVTDTRYHRFYKSVAVSVCAATISFVRDVGFAPYQYPQFVRTLVSSRISPPQLFRSRSPVVSPKPRGPDAPTRTRDRNPYLVIHVDRSNPNPRLSSQPSHDSHPSLPGNPHSLVAPVRIFGYAAMPVTSFPLETPLRVDTANASSSYGMGTTVILVIPRCLGALATDTITTSLTKRNAPLDIASRLAGRVALGRMAFNLFPYECLSLLGYAPSSFEDAPSFLPLSMFGESPSFPIVEMSLDASLSPLKNWAIGKVLTEVRSEGYLSIAGGLTIHSFANNLEAFNINTAKLIIQEFHNAITDTVVLQDPGARRTALESLTNHRVFLLPIPRRGAFYSSCTLRLELERWVDPGCIIRNDIRIRSQRTCFEEAV
ncbi:hypothetical protein BS47DRAFT_1490010 [Hydnum rufescens UP504]|uniref:Uncharacterized protein n=1 Tax=Hydnum rufescens UP504 TaxID=1448309 RepID=A0A9P6DHU2_9AGAM|nr:hypothetical protein BS47DRAFT_1490010 [Hydnum rufescens UP504]